MRDDRVSDARTTTHRRVRLYHQLRTAHLERAAQLPPATIVYGRRRYDFDDDLARSLDLVHAGGVRAAWYLLRHPVDGLEINEPLYASAARTTALALLGVRFARLVGRPRTQVVSYAIENLDPFSSRVTGGVKARLARRLDLALVRFVWSQVDRIAFGTEAAEQLYRRRLSWRPGPTATLVPALPVAAVTEPPTKVADQVLFVGAFSDRKGIRQLLAAWPTVRTARPAARLVVVGQGLLEATVKSQAATDASITVVVDPPRDWLRAHQAESPVVVLASQPSLRWREQVGLPIVEGLSYGATIVTTAETGLATWLRDHGHRVIDDAGSTEDLAAALVSALADPVPVAEVLASLPTDDGRLAADAWLFAGGDEETR